MDADRGYIGMNVDGSVSVQMHAHVRGSMRMHSCIHRLARTHAHIHADWQERKRGRVKGSGGGKVRGRRSERENEKKIRQID